MLECTFKANEIRAPRGKRRKLSDEELDSGDDEGRRDRADDEMEEDTYQKTETMTEVKLGRHGIPKGTDGEVALSPAAHLQLLTLY